MPHSSSLTSGLGARRRTAPALAPLILASGRAVAIRVRRHPRSRRFVLRVSGGVIQLTIPTRARLDAAEAWVRRQADFVEKKIAEEPAPVPFAMGTVLPLLGEERTVAHTDGRRARLDDGRLLVPNGEAEAVAARVTRLVRREALAFAEETLAAFWRELDVPPAAVSVRAMSRRWGSCAADGRTTLNWRLAFAPLPVFRYVCAHEAAHRLEMNHGAGFWDITAALCPDYPQHERWLRQQGQALFRFGRAS